jgi:hypothetical protein
MIELDVNGSRRIDDGLGDVGDLAGFWSRQARRVRNIGKQIGRAAEATTRVVGGAVTGNAGMVARGVRQAGNVATELATSAAEQIAQDVGGDRARRQVRNVGRQIRNVVNNAANVVTDPLGVAQRTAARAMGGNNADPFANPAFRSIQTSGPTARLRNNLTRPAPAQPQRLVTRNAPVVPPSAESSGGVGKVFAALGGLAAVGGVAWAMTRKGKGKR